MEVTGIVELINSVGFPIAVCLILFWFINRILSKFELRLAELTNSVVDNTQAIRSLVDRIGRPVDV